MSGKPVFVAQPDLPPLEDFIPSLEKIWANRTLTNNGPFHQQLEHALRDYLGVPEIVLFNNGTIALIAALKALGLAEGKAEVITTPYSFVATAHSLLWNNMQPVFVDIDPATFNLDPMKIEAAITPRTAAILPVHCYGNPCDVDAIREIAERHELRVIYDAAHAFGVRDNGGSILRHGDLSVLSFHATKVFNTVEGGAVICHDAKTRQRLCSLRNFGIVDEVTVEDVGINGKMSEIHAAFGLLQLEHVDDAIARRREIDARYRDALRDVDGIRVPPKGDHAASNYAYFPILVEPEYPLRRDALYQELKDSNIFARRYFYPLITDFPMYRNLASAADANLPVARNIAERVLCLPIYPDLDSETVSKIAGLIRKGQRPLG